MNKNKDINIDHVVKDAEEAKKIMVHSLKNLALMAGEFKDRKPYHKLIEAQLRRDWKRMQAYHMQYPNSRFFEADEVRVAAFKALPPEVYKRVYTRRQVDFKILRLAEIARRHGISYSPY